MDNLEKSRIRLTHWIDHNLDHLRGYSEVAATLEAEGVHSAAEKIRQGIRLIEEANSEFTKALAEISKAAGNNHVHHSHSHEHGGEHSHSHVHSHDHTHDD
ncbi:MAG: hypothetical protein V1792_02760 [Pseudomonadota bacterium]